MSNLTIHFADNLVQLDGPDDPELLGRDLVVTHVARHPEAAVHAAILN